ncbi:hypothetical protein [Terasakiella pusilla]|uniref:hypothetical protein n=1 Tax=Terasakiella pusilla TaxID=64973 RepID=UPI003AA89899
MKRTHFLIPALGVTALIGATTIALAADSDKDDYCPRGKGGYQDKMMRGEHRGGMGGLGIMGGKHMGRFMKDGNYDLQLTPERVKEIMEGRIAWSGNENLKVGDVSTDKEGQIIAKIVTKDNSLVETFKVDPKTGARVPLR